MKCFALIRMVGGAPDLPQALYDVGEKFNYVLCDRISGTNWGAYLCAARGPVLQQLDTQYNGFIGIVAVSESGEVHWGELENPCSDTMRNRINAWLTERGQPTITPNWTNRQVVRAIYEWANDRFDIRNFNVMDV